MALRISCSWVPEPLAVTQRVFVRQGLEKLLISNLAGLLAGSSNQRWRHALSPEIQGRRQLAKIRRMLFAQGQETSAKEMHDNIILIYERCM